jgi:hypothetical protein
LAHGLGQQGISEHRASVLLGRRQFSDHAISVGHKYGFTVCGKSHVFA